MSKKLTNNGMWESSRMMLPEHKARINQLSLEQKKRPRAHLDEQEWEQISKSVNDSLSNHKEISIKIYHPVEVLIVTGMVDRIDKLNSRFKVDGNCLLLRISRVLLLKSDYLGIQK
ncbi:YolD-like family protein [Paenibacillus nanensis]|uniref:YolD-like family protein n=1 Tax=Paenibacillus nanensis TaxID=393251 RepID=A0A3A1VG18_9BACL|nr:YolD-like family protein [Paenibacillus nanensis]RIX59291.1 YolD-like family protein [Paenibacillus nanensis]